MTTRLPMAGELAPGPATHAAPRWAITRKGFRLFFLLAAAYAALAVPLWLAMLHGKLAAPHPWVGRFWHAHEMLFGFTVAVIAGFLLTAVGNWTSRETATGGSLLALAGVWLAGRVLFSPPEPCRRCSRPSSIWRFYLCSPRSWRGRSGRRRAGGTIHFWRSWACCSPEIC